MHSKTKYIISNNNNDLRSKNKISNGFSCFVIVFVITKIITICIYIYSYVHITSILVFGSLTLANSRNAHGNRDAQFEYLWPRILMLIYYNNILL